MDNLLIVLTLYQQSDRYYIYGFIFRECSSPQKLLSAKDDHLFATANLLAVQYPDDLSPELHRQFISFRNVLWLPIKESERLN
jgi:hypothetical protein